MLEKVLDNLVTELAKLNDNFEQWREAAPLVVPAVPAAEPETPAETPKASKPVKAPIPAQEAAPLVVPEVPAAAAEKPAVPKMTMQQLNDALGDEYVRLGSKREPIDEAIRSFNVQSLKDLDPAKYGELLAAVRAK